MSYSTYITRECDRCKEKVSISCEEIVANSNKLGTPRDWQYRDLGINGPEPYLICNKCKNDYKKKEADSFREFIKNI